MAGERKRSENYINTIFKYNIQIGNDLRMVHMLSFGWWVFPLDGNIYNIYI